MLPEVDDPRDATYKHFAHPVAHECRHCAAIRSIGPAGFTSILARMQAMNVQRVEGSVTTDEEAERAVARFPKKQQRKAARLAHKRDLRGIKGLLLAITRAA